MKAARQAALPAPKEVSVRANRRTVFSARQEKRQTQPKMPVSSASSAISIHTLVVSAKNAPHTLIVRLRKGVRRTCTLIAGNTSRLQTMLTTMFTRLKVCRQAICANAFQPIDNFAQTHSQWVLFFRLTKTTFS